MKERIKILVEAGIPESVAKAIITEFASEVWLAAKEDKVDNFYSWKNKQLQ